MRLQYVFIWTVLLSSTTRCTDSRTTCKTMPSPLLEGDSATLVCSFPEPVTKIRSDILVQRNTFNNASASAPSVLECPLSVQQDPDACFVEDGYNFKGFSHNSNEVAIYIQNVSKEHEGSYTCQLVGHSSSIIPCNFTLGRSPHEDTRSEMETTQLSVSITSTANGTHVNNVEESGRQSSVRTIVGATVGGIALLLTGVISAFVVYKKCFRGMRAKDGLIYQSERESGNPCSSDYRETERIHTDLNRKCTSTEYIKSSEDSGSRERRGENILSEADDGKGSSRKRDRSVSDKEKHAVGTNGEKHDARLSKETAQPGSTGQDNEENSCAQSGWKAEQSFEFWKKMESGEPQDASGLCLNLATARLINPQTQRSRQESAWVLDVSSKQPDMSQSSRTREANTKELGALTSIMEQPTQSTVHDVPKAREEPHVLGYTSTEQGVEGTVLCQESDTAELGDSQDARGSRQQRNAVELQEESESSPPAVDPTVDDAADIGKWTPKSSLDYWKEIEDDGAAQSLLNSRKTKEKNRFHAMPTTVHESNEMNKTVDPQGDTESTPPDVDPAVDNVANIANSTWKNDEPFENKEEEGSSMEIQEEPISARTAVDQTVEDAANSGKGKWTPKTSLGYWKEIEKGGTAQPLLDSRQKTAKIIFHAMTKSDQDIGDDAEMSPFLTQTE